MALNSLQLSIWHTACVSTPSSNRLRLGAQLFTGPVISVSASLSLEYETDREADIKIWTFDFRGKLSDLPTKFLRFWSYFDATLKSVNAD